MRRVAGLTNGAPMVRRMSLHNWLMSTMFQNKLFSFDKDYAIAKEGSDEKRSTFKPPREVRPATGVRSSLRLVHHDACNVNHGSAPVMNKQ
jgi:hypothetical protein